MIYHLKTSKRKRPTLLIPLVVAALVSVLVLILQMFSPRLLSGAITALAEPLFGARSMAANVLAASDGYFTSRASLQKEIDLLRANQTKVATVLSNFKGLQKENEELRALLGRTPHVEKTILASILSKPPFSPYDTFLVDAGTEQNVDLNATVRSEQGIVIGKVAEVNADSSLIRLSSSAGEKIQIALGSTTEAVEAEGKGGGMFEIKVPQGSSVTEGDPIYMPPNFSEHFATVEKIDTSPEDSFEAIYFRLPVKLSGEKWVLIEKR